LDVRALRASDLTDRRPRGWIADMAAGKLPIMIERRFNGRDSAERRILGEEYAAKRPLEEEVARERRRSLRHLLRRMANRGQIAIDQNAI